MAKTRVRDASYRVLDHEPNAGEVFGERTALGISSGRPLTRIDTKLNYRPIRAQWSPFGRKSEWLKAIAAARQIRVSRDAEFEKRFLLWLGARSGRAPSWCTSGKKWLDNRVPRTRRK